MAERKPYQGWLLLAHAFVAAGLLLSACRGAAFPHAPTFTLGMADKSAAVTFKFKVPRKPIKPRYDVLGTAEGGSTVTVNKLEISLSGPGFLSPLYPYLYPTGEMAVQSDQVESNFLFVPTGWNRFVQVVAKNDSQKIHQVGGVLHVNPGAQNHVSLSLASTPTAWVIQKIAKVNPQLLQGDGINVSSAFPYKELQYWLDSKVTQIVQDDPANQNKFNGFHPYRVNAQGILDYMQARNWAVDFKKEPFTTNALDSAYKPEYRKMVLHPGRVRVITGSLPAGSRVWINDPISPVMAGDPAKTEYVFSDVAPSFEPAAPTDPLTEWTANVVSGDKVVSADFSVARITMDQPAATEVVLNLADYISGVNAANATITKIKLTPAGRDWAGAHVELNGRVTQQLFAYAETADGTVTPLTPDMLDWRVVDAKAATPGDVRLQVGNGTTSPYELNDYGLVYPLGETVPTDPTDLLRVEASLRTHPAASGAIHFTVKNLGDASGRTLVTVKGERVYLSTDTTSFVPAPAPNVVLSGMLAPNAQPIKLVEPVEAPPGTTYRWTSDHPLVKFVDATAGPIAQVYCLGDLSGASAKIQGYSSTGRWAEGTVTTAFTNGLASTSVAGPGVNFAFAMLNTLSENTGGNSAFRSSTNATLYPLGGYLAEKGNIYMKVVDSTDASAKFFWRSSDASYISVEPYGAALYPSTMAKLTSHREGSVTITAMDAYGREVSTPITFRFDRGLTDAVLRLPVNPYEIQMNTTPATVESLLVEQYATALVEAREAVGPGPDPNELDPPTARFTWASNDPLRLEVLPPPGESFPNKRAMLRTLRPGLATIRLVSGTTEKISRPYSTSNVIARQFGYNISYGTASVTPNAWSGTALRVGQVDPGTGITSFAPAGTVSGYGVGQIVTLAVEDSALVTASGAGADTAEPFMWSTEQPRTAQLLTATGKRVQVRMMGLGTHIFRVVNPNTGRWGVYTLNVVAAPTGSVGVRVRL